MTITNRAPDDTGHVRLVALDLDGTLLNSDGALSERNAAALRAAKRGGLELVIVSARPPRRVRALAERTELPALAICSNGSVVYDIARDCILRQTSIELAQAHALVVRLRARLPSVAFAIEAGARYGCEPHYTTPPEHAPDAVDPALLRADALALCALGSTKLIVQHAASSLPALLALVTEHAMGLGVTHSGSQLVEVAPAGVSKASALAELCALRGITAEQVIAFGDMPNDLPMLRWAGRSVAVANAHPDVLAAAHEITASNDDDGVAQVLERLLS